MGVQGFSPEKKSVNVNLRTSNKPYFSNKSKTKGGTGGLPRLNYIKYHEIRRGGAGGLPR